MVIGAHDTGPGNASNASLADLGKDPLTQLKKAAGDLEEQHGVLRRMLEEAERTQHRIEQAKRAWVSAFDAVPDPIFMHDREFRIVRANRAYAERAGLDFPDLLGKRYWEVFPKSSAPLPSCARAVQEAGASEVDDEIRLDTGEILLSRAFPVRDASGTSLYSIHILENVTKKRRSDASRYVLSEALRQAAEGIAVLDPAFRIRYANHSLRHLLDTRADDLVGQPLDILFTEQESPRVPAIRDAATRQGHWAGEIALREAHGASLPVNLSLARVTEHNGNVTAYVGTFTDLRPLRKAAESLHQSEERYRRLFETLGDAACLVNIDGDITDANPPAEKLLGRTHDELVGAHLDALWPPGRAQENHRLFAERAARGHTLELGTEVARPDGSSLPVTLSMTSITVGEKPMVLVLLRPAEPKPETAGHLPAPGTATVVQLMDENMITGMLREIDFESGFVVVTHPREGEQRVAFDAVRSLTLPGPFPAPAETASHAFRVLYRDGTELTGTAQAVTSNHHGVHLQLQNPDGSLRRIFIPAQVIEQTFLPPPIGEALHEAGAVSTVEITSALEKQKDLRTKRLGEYLQAAAVHTVEELRQRLARRDTYPAQKLGEALLAEGLITPRQLDAALKEQGLNRNKRLGDILIEAHATTPQALHTVLARTLGIPFVHLHEFDVEKDVLPLVGVELARKHLVIPLMLHNERLVVAMEDPVNLEVIALLRFVVGRELEVAVATRDDVLWAIGKYYEASDKQDETESLESLESTELTEGISVAASEEQAFADAERLGQERPVVRLVNTFILEGIRRRASDIHLHPFRDHADLNYRIDGTLVKVRSFNIKLLAALVARIKIIARLDLAERRLPQDGAARALYEGRTVDLRISVIPTVDGESVVIRILNTEAGLKVLSQLGFNNQDEMQFADLLHKSYGILLVTGPTGSGKSTTLYAALGEVIKQNVNVITVEDPVEYHIPGIEQIQVNTATGYTFAKALRHILRHDPDAILIGEIRDEETGKIAIQSALTGHLVLSSLHTNDAASSITRLLEMGVEPYLLSATLLGVLAQRLVRRNCPHCLEIEEVDPLIRRVLGVAEDEVFYKGRGCEHCNNTCYSGRMAVYEFLLLNNDLRARIVTGVTVEDIRQQAVKNGMVPLTQNALAQARARKTSLMEVYRVRLE